MAISLQHIGALEFVRSRCHTKRLRMSLATQNIATPVSLKAVNLVLGAKVSALANCLIQPMVSILSVILVALLSQRNVFN